MMLINYVMPGFSSLLTPVLRKMGEKRLSVIAGLITSLSNFLPPLVGFYGMAHEHAASRIAAGVIITAFVLRSLATVLQQVTSNMLVAANSGKISEKASSKTKNNGVQQSEAEQAVTWQEVKSRAKQVLFPKRESGQATAQNGQNKEWGKGIRNLLMYNLSFVYKNLGTMLFLSLPWLLNKIIYLVSGYEAHLVYSVSFPIFGVYALAVTLQTLRANLRDAYSVPTVQAASKAAHDAASHIAQNLVDAAQNSQSSEQDISNALDAGARKLRGHIDNMVEAQRKNGLHKKEVPAFREQAAQKLLPEVLSFVHHALPVEKSEQITKGFEEAFHQIENKKITLWQIFNHGPAVAAITIAMTLATVHEFTISSAFAMNLNHLIPNGDTANLLVAAALYIPMIIGRLGGNVLASRVSSGTMYVLCSALSALGTLIMMVFAGHISGAIIGAVISSLGMGNFFSQMYDYITKKNPKHVREISVILSLTMAFGGVLTMPAYHFNEWFGGNNLDITYALFCLVGSLVLTTNMMANSTLMKFVKNKWNVVKEKTHQSWQDFSGRNKDKGPDMNNPLPN